MYLKFGKRFLDILLSGLAMLMLCWLYPVLAILVWLKLGRPIIFKQPRPGKNNKIFYIYKFKTMLEATDAKGESLPDDVRLTSFGKFLRKLSLDEIPELWNIFKGDMSFVGPRPQLVKDMVFFDEKQMERQKVLPGLTGLAQVSGRNSISWEEKLEIDLVYIRKITFWQDTKIFFKTFITALIQQDGITSDGLATAKNYGDCLLEDGKISREEYELKIRESKELLAKFKQKEAK
ncbi:MAG: sugar transferase [Clostridia bacterium]|nr:sugar transferase [Clostridia bacterium]